METSSAQGFFSPVMQSLNRYLFQIRPARDADVGRDNTGESTAADKQLTCYDEKQGNQRRLNAEKHRCRARQNKARVHRQTRGERDGIHGCKQADNPTQKTGQGLCLGSDEKASGR